MLLTLLRKPFPTVSTNQNYFHPSSPRPRLLRSCPLQAVLSRPHGTAPAPHARSKPGDSRGRRLAGCPGSSLGRSFTPQRATLGPRRARRETDMDADPEFWFCREDWHFLSSSERMCRRPIEGLLLGWGQGWLLGVGSLGGRGGSEETTRRVKRSFQEDTEVRENLKEELGQGSGSRSGFLRCISSPTCPSGTCPHQGRGG